MKTAKGVAVSTRENEGGWHDRSLRDAGGRLAFATLVLASVIDDVEGAIADGRGGSAALRATVDALRRSLMTQERLNEFLPTEAVREGSRRFRAWCEAGSLKQPPSLRDFAAPFPANGAAAVSKREI